MKRKIRVLVVDDSMVIREALARGMGSDPAIEVVGIASDAYIASKMIIELKPDVVTLDVEMPIMNGIEFLKRLMDQYPIPVVMISAMNNSVFEALQAGAVDFVCKPEGYSERSVSNFINEMIIKIKIASMARVGQRKNDNVHRPQAVGGGRGSKIKMIAMGASTGGTEAIASIIRNLPVDLPGIVIVQHMPPVFTRMYAARLNDSCEWEIREAVDGDMIRPGLALIAPGGYHMTVSKGGTGYTVRCWQGDKVNGHCPSVDVLFNSVSSQVRGGALGVILTGMGADGAKGLMAMRQSGAVTIGQDEHTSVIYGMPKVAFTTGAVELQASLEKIPALICSAIAGK